MEKAELLNWVANRPEVLAGAAPGYEGLDLSAFFDDPRNMMFGDEKGVILFQWCAPGVYEIHYLFTALLRGAAALRVIRAALRVMFTYRDATAIVGATPRENRAARAINRALGARPTGVSVDSQGRDCITYALERSTWAISSGV